MDKYLISITLVQASYAVNIMIRTFYIFKSDITLQLIKNNWKGSNREMCFGGE